MKRTVSKDTDQSASLSILDMSGWPSGLRRQTQAQAYLDYKGIAFWSSTEGVGSNPTSDKNFFQFFYFFKCFFDTRDAP